MNALSARNETSRSQVRSPVDPQTQSPLFAMLPAELRTLIWRFALLDGAHGQHILKSYTFNGPEFERLLCHVQPDADWLAHQPRYSRSAAGSRDWSSLVTGNNWRDGHLGCAPPGYFYSDGPQNARLRSPTDVLLTCRKVQAETMDFLHAKIARIPFWELENLLEAVPESVLGSRLKELEVWVMPTTHDIPFAEGDAQGYEDSSVSLARRWRNLCERLARLQELRSFKVWVNIESHPGLQGWTTDQNEVWIQSLELLTGKVQDVEVSVNSVGMRGEDAVVAVGNVRVRKRREPAWVYGAQELDLKGGESMGEICGKYEHLASAGK